MRKIPKERILRVNCPGYGVEANFNLGSAKPLNNYSAIIVNPVSIAHLFDKDPELVRRIDSSLTEGHTTFKTEDDLVVRNIAAEAESRILELSDFLTQGGFLVYFLCRPFTLKSNNVAVDNYYWLETLAPDQPTEQNVRHMSAVAQGRLVEVTGKGDESKLAPYLKQQGLEWSTIIRDDFLTDGYHLLATAGPNKCIAGQLYIMQSNGRVAFLPAPFSPDFDRTLIDCLNQWYNEKEPSEAEKEAEAKEAEALQLASAQPVSAPAPGPEFFNKEQEEFRQETSAELLREEPVEPEPMLAPPETPATEAPPSQAAPSTQEIDLSIFAQTARQLAEKTTSSQEVSKEAAEAKMREIQELQKAVVSAPDPSPEAPVNQPDVADTLPEQVNPVFDTIHQEPINPINSSDTTNTTDAVDNSIAEKIASDLVQESLKLEPPQTAPPPQPPPESVSSDLAESEPSPIPTALTRDKIGETVVTNNDNLQDEQERKQKAMDALRELQQSHPQAAPPQSAPTPPGHAVPQAAPAQQAPAPVHTQPAPAAPAQAAAPQAPPAEQAAASKPLLNTLFKKEGAGQAPVAQAQQAPPAQPRPVVQSNLPVPEWCKAFSFSYLDDLRNEQSTLSEQLQSIQAKLNTVESRIASVDQLKQALLAGEPGVLIDACNTVLSRLGWTVGKSARVSNEILLSNVDQPEGLARVVRSDDQCGRTEVAQLAESAISFWDEHEIEPKGVLIACTWATVAPDQRNQPDFSDSLRKFAEKKNLCLMTAMQLLGVYRDIELGATSPEAVRKQILETNGHLSGYEVEKGVVGAGAAV